MRPSSTPISRRSFIAAAAPVTAFGLSAFAFGQTVVERNQFTEDDIPAARERLLKMVNDERANLRLSPLLLDDLACRVATVHALDMASGDFLSHWGSDGRKPYHRYSFAGGTEAVRENLSSADNIQSLASTGVLKDLRDMHELMVNEVPPNDGHRKAIILPENTHVGFGVVLRGRKLKLVELYLARYVEIEPIPQKAKPQAIARLSGRILNRRNAIIGVDTYYEPLPSPPAFDWLRSPRSYGMPASFTRSLPKLPGGYTYPDGSTGSVESHKDGRFRVRIKLSQKPGINTIMVWLRAGSSGVSFPVTQICIRVE